MPQWVNVYRREGTTLLSGEVYGGTYAEMYIGRLNDAGTDVEIVYTVATEGRSDVLGLLTDRAVDALNAADNPPEGE